MRFAGAALTALVAVAANPAWGDGSNDPSAAAAVADEIAHKQKMLSLFPDSAGSTQATPSVIPQLETDVDPKRDDRDVSAERADTDRDQRFFPGPGEQWPHLLHLSPASGRLDRQRTARAGAV